MKFRIASSIVLSAGLIFGASGCGLIAPQATLEPYAASDGINVDVADVNLRNLMLIADESGKAFNVVFSSVNLTGEEREIAIEFVQDGEKQARAEFTIPTGNASFGNPDGEIAPVVVKIDDLQVGATAKAFVQAEGAAEAERAVPVLDGLLSEYEDYVLPKGFTAKSKIADAASDKKAADGEQAATEGADGATEGAEGTDSGSN